MRTSTLATRLSCGFCDGPLQPTDDRCRDKPELFVGRCSACGLKQLADMTHATPEWYRSDDTIPPDMAAERKRQWRWNRKRLTRLMQLIPDAPSKAVLDYGCGTGSFLQQAQTVFREVVGFELNPRVSAAHRQAGWRCVSALEEVRQEIDVIVLLHVLEHLREPWALLRDLSRRFPRAQEFVIEVPNTDEALLSLFKNDAYRRNHHNAQHLWYFTPETLRRVVERAGLAVAVEEQLQRYSLANNLSWLSRGRGDDAELRDFLDDEPLNDQYERVLASMKMADSIFFVCRPSRVGR
jgi:SAM-dependent methyltransferase